VRELRLGSRLPISDLLAQIRSGEVLDTLQGISRHPLNGQSRLGTKNRVLTEMLPQRKFNIVLSESAWCMGGTILRVCFESFYELEQYAAELELQSGISRFTRRNA
jgi:hypothetical protein